MSAIIDQETLHTPGCYPKRNIALVKGEGAIVWDDEGNRYIDCVGGIGVATIGHGNPTLAKALAEQAGKLVVCPEIFHNDQRARLLERYAAITPDNMNRFFLSNSGAEAVEGALKIARLATGRKEIIAFRKGFHGRTFGALTATATGKYRNPFLPLVPDFHHVPYNRLDELAETITEQTAAVILEVIQGEGGIIEAKPEFLQGVRELCDQHGALLIFDEIQTGFGRTGKMFGHQHFNVLPDIMTLAKGIGGGFPIGMVCFGDKVGELPKGSHGSTFGGNALACAAANAALDVLEQEQLVERCRETGAYFREKLEAIDSPLIRSVRGKGLLLGLELKKRVQEFVVKLMGERILALPAGTTVLRFLPPVVIQREEVDEVIAAVTKVLTTDG
jgi:LysW-gamma-L-lysine/LysW-L-ornithine aminotransferase